MTISDKALELIVRDVLDGMEELANQERFNCCMENFDIIEIAAHSHHKDKAPLTSTPPTTARVLVFPDLMPEKDSFMDPQE